MLKRDIWQNIVWSLYHYFLFFALTAFLVTCSMTLFISTLSADLGLVLTGDNLNRAAKLTFLNVILLSVLFTLSDVLRRKFTTERITKHITAAARELMKGNFDVRISPVGKIGFDGNYAEIIECFNKMAQELGSLETLRTDFIANVSHEMKTPLAVMQNYGALLRLPELPEEKRLAYADGIMTGCRRMADMVTNILNLNRLENQQVFPQGTCFDLGEQLCECLLPFENVWEKKKIEIETKIEDHVNVQADRELLSLVWNNLLSNAFKFTPMGGMVSVSLISDGKDAVIRIRDTGCGMTEEIGKHIFEKFYQGDTSHAVQGNGLGLALVRRVMDIIKGEISVESTAGAGSVFTVRIKKEKEN